MMSLSDIVIEKHVCKLPVDKQVASDSSALVRGLTLSDLIQYAQRAKDAGEFVDLILEGEKHSCAASQRSVQSEGGGALDARDDV